MEFSQLSWAIVVAAGAGFVFRLAKQPLLVGYLFAGVILYHLGILREVSLLEGLGQVGVTLLLFLLGIEMKLKELPEIGKPALFTGLGQIAFTSTFGYLLARLLGFSSLPSVYLAIALTFSSTIIMVKLLSEKKDLASMYGKIAVGFLLIQDLVAVVILTILGSIGRGRDLVAQDYLMLILKAAVLVLVISFLSKRILPRLFDKVASYSIELVFIVSIAWALGVASFTAGPVGFSLEIGGFLAGLALSNLSEHLQIAGRAKPLRDFFLTIFFVILGIKLASIGLSGGVIMFALLFSIFVLLGNPLIVLVIMGMLGYKKRTSFMAGLTVAQISEFSLIIVYMGQNLGHIGPEVVSVTVLVGVITMTISTYMIEYSEKIYALVSPFLGIFERRNTREDVLIDKHSTRGHVVLVGCDRAGRLLVKFFLKKNIDFIVVDFNPTVFRRMVSAKVKVVFGDISDEDVSANLNLSEAKMIVSTIGNYSDDLLILERLKKFEPRPITIFTSKTQTEAIRLYEKGADLVVVPDLVAGEHVRNIINIYGPNAAKIKRLGKAGFNRLIYAKSKI